MCNIEKQIFSLAINNYVYILKVAQLIQCSPVVLFVFNRLAQTRITITALQKNNLAPFTDLIIYSDGPRSFEDDDSVCKVREYLRTVRGFKSIKICEREKNFGLASSIMSGLGEQFNNYESLIVLEDDVLVSRSFLSFMNDCIYRFKDEKDVWHISGWNYPLSTSFGVDVFKWQVMNCWGWATWKDRWCKFERKPVEQYNKLAENNLLRFDLGLKGLFSNQILDNIHSKKKTWAVFWYLTIFLNAGRCINPIISFTENIGHDGSGVHSGNFNPYKQSSLNEKYDLDLRIDDQISLEVEQAIHKYLKRDRMLSKRIIRRFSRIFNSGKELDS